MIPLFSTDYSLSSKSLITVDRSSEINELAPISVVSIAKKYGLNPCFIVESNPSSFLKCFKFFKEENLDFIFGIRLKIVNDISIKSPESLDNESRAIIFLNNVDGYKNFLKIYTTSSVLGKYYTNRADWKTLKDNWCDSLTLCFPFYDSFICNNLLRNSTIVPDFPAEPVFFLEDHDLPFDGLIKEAVENYTSQNNYKTWNTHSCYYYKNSDVLAYQVFRTMNEGSTMAMPNLDHFSSDQFSFESYLSRVGKTL